VVFGILKSSQWGLIEPRGALTIGGTEITPFGFSAVPFFILAGRGLLACFAIWEERRERLGRDVLLDRSLLRIPPLRAGLTTLMMQQLLCSARSSCCPSTCRSSSGWMPSRPASASSRCR
jgi:hypothetical protein